MGREGMDDEGQRSTSHIIKDVVEELGYECVHVAFGAGPTSPGKKGRGALRVQVMIDSLGGIGTDDCETVSKSLSRRLDEEDMSLILEGRYWLEVSSPGLERPLFTPAQYGRFCGHEARLRLNEPVEGRRSATGKIVAADEERVVLYIDDEEREISIPFGSIRSGNLVFRGLEPTDRKGRASKGGRGERGSFGGARRASPLRGSARPEREEVPMAKDGETS